MPDQKPPSVINYLNQVPDYRIDTPNKRHDLTDILVIALCAMISGAEDWVTIQLYAKTKESWFKKFLSLPNGIPSHDTFNRVFSRIDPDAFMDCFIRWVKDSGMFSGKEVVAIDGKTIKGSGKSKAHSAIHMVNAWAVESQLVLGQLKTQAKSNEITAIPELIEALVLEGCIITMDAMGCQKTITKKIIEKKADYALAVKNNHPKLLQAIKEAFDIVEQNINEATVSDFHEVDNLSRDRLEVRRCWVLSAQEAIGIYNEWENLNTLVKIESERTHQCKTSIEHRYYISSCASNAELMNKVIRSHWGVENSLHWLLDVTFKEDDCLITKGHGAENLARLRHFALNLLKQDKETKAGVKGKRMKAGWDNEYLIKLLKAI